MKITNTYHNLIPKTKWPSGIWNDEPDYCKFTYLNYECKILRIPHSGHLSGYIKLFRKLSSDMDNIKIHGGFSYKHKNLIGFDCAHAGDFCPGALNNYSRNDDIRYKTYRSFWYVVNELKSLVNQLVLNNY